MPITIVSPKDLKNTEKNEISSGRITIELNNKESPPSSEKYAVVISNLPVELNYKDLKSQVFPDFEAMYEKLSDGVFFAILGEKAQVMRFCKKYNLASVDGQEIRCAPVIKLDYENVVNVELKK